MKLATLDNGTRDGVLVIVSQDNQHFIKVDGTTLQNVMDDWEKHSSTLKQQYEKLNKGELDSEKQAVDVKNLLSPLPRAYEWIDGSAYINHVVLVRKARNAEPPATLKTDPLVYQGGSGKFLRPTEDIRHFSEDYGIDFESEVCVVTDDVPMGTTKEEAAKHIKLILICNDVSLRNLIPKELEKGFGFLVSKPSTAFSPFAITPDELGDAWKDGRVHLPLVTVYNGNLFGNPDAGPAMFFGFNELIQHVTQTRALTAGTIIGSGTVSNEDRSKGSSCLAEKRMLEKIDSGNFVTPFMKFGDTVEIEMKDANGNSLFGKISQKVAKAEK
ncbi:yisK [Acrasis kona]|uniref:YisK n=1 Tax=Acrasis kona TaxID=1008807 RepID=A0AAW2YK64_9EUKA